MKKVPEIIYLQWHTEECAENCGHEVTWCEDKIEETDEEYIRKDTMDKIVKSALNAIRSYRYGNAPSELAEEVEYFIMRNYYR